MLLLTLLAILWAWVWVSVSWLYAQSNLQALPGFSVIPGGSFIMGSADDEPGGDPDEGPRYQRPANRVPAGPGRGAWVFGIRLAHDM